MLFKQKGGNGMGIPMNTPRLIIQKALSILNFLNRLPDESSAADHHWTKENSVPLQQPIFFLNNIDQWVAGVTQRWRRGFAVSLQILEK